MTLENSNFSENSFKLITSVKEEADEDMRKC